MGGKHGLISEKHQPITAPLGFVLLNDSSKTLASFFILLNLQPFFLL